MVSSGGATLPPMIYYVNCDTSLCLCAEAIPAEVKKIVYISCDPATQVRDAGYLLDSGFKTVKRKGFDMFPQTYHMENVLILERI